MVRGRKPLSTAEKEASGAYDKDPQRRNHDEPQATIGRPEKPAHISEDPMMSQFWDSTCEQLEGLGVLTIDMGPVLVLMCRDWVQAGLLYDATKGGNVTTINVQGNVVVSPEVNQYHKFADRFLRYLSELGLTPSSRSRLKVERKEDDAFAEWLKGRMGGSN